MLTAVFLNSFDVEGFIDRKFAPYVATPGIAHAFAQGVVIPGRYGGHAWDIFNTAFWEINYSTPIAASSVVVLHLNIKPTYHSVDPFTQSWFKVLFVRFQFDNANNVGLRINETGHIEVILGGDGKNVDGSVIATTAETFPVEQWADIELRVACGSPGNIRLWKNGVEILNVNATTPLGSLINIVTLRWETFGPPGMAFDDMAIGIGDATVERFGVSRVVAMLPAADYRLGAWLPLNTWPYRPSGLPHYACVNDQQSDLDRGSPDDDTSYLQGGPGAGEDLFGITTPLCLGANLAVAVNVTSKAIVDAGSVQPIFLSSDEGATREVGAPLSSAADRYAVQQRLMQLSPMSGEYWTDAEIAGSAWGIRGASGNTIRVSGVYVEKLISLAGLLPFECPGSGGNSYIY